MRNPILRTAMLALPLISIAAYSGDCFAAQPGDSFVFSSDEAPNGSSYLGVDTRDITPDRLAPLQLKDESGVEVTMVDQDAPAGKAGLKEHDVILSVNEEKVESVEQLRRLIREIPPGRVITIGVFRDGKPISVKVQLGSRKKFGGEGKEFNFVMPPMPPIPPMPSIDIDIPVSIVVVHSSARSGLMIENLTPQLGEFFGAKDGRGVLVRSVEKGSNAEKAGFHAGDVIVKINGEFIHDAGDFSRVLHDRKPANNAVSVGIIRDRKEQTITLTLPERKESDVFQESMDLPEVNARVRPQIDQARVQMAEVRPQIRLAMQNFKDLRPELEKQLVDLRRQEGEVKVQIQKQMEQLKRALPEQLRQWRGNQADI